jgi:UDP-glucose 4-epimerase
MSLENAVDLVLYAFKRGKAGEIFVQKSPAANIRTLASALKEILNTSKHKTKIIGTRHGEKLYEVLLSREEMARAQESKYYYCIHPDIRDLNYEKFIDKGEKKISKSQEYNSNNTVSLNIKKMKKLLLKQDFIRSIIKKKLKT